MKIVLKFFLIIGLQLNTIFSFAQLGKIDTVLIKQRYVGQSHFPSMTPSNIFKSDDEDKAQYKGMPIGLDTFQLSFIPFDIQQYYYDRLRKGKINQIDLMKRFENNIDTSSLSKKFIKHRVGILSGLKGKNKLVIVDANNNYDFSDDKVFQFDTIYYFKRKWNMVIDSMPSVDMKYEIFNGSQVETRISSQKIVSYCENYSYKDDMMKKLEVYYYGNDYYLSISNINGKLYGFEIEKKNNTLILPPDSLKSKYLKKENFIYQINEKFVINGNIYSIFKISRLRDTLFLKNIGKGEIIEGNKIGSKSISFCKKDVSDSLICVNNQKRKYVLIDFWGTWCNPCIASIPDLKKIRDSFSIEELEIISVAVDNNLDKVKESIKKYKMNWGHLQEERNSKMIDALTSLFNVQAFPTTILIDKKGVIIERGSGSDFVEALYDKLKIILK